MVAPPISEIANTTIPKLSLIVGLLRLLFPQRLNLLDPAREATQRAYGCSVDHYFRAGGDTGEPAARRIGVTLRRSALR
jgi:hypothetical protein